MTNTVTCTCSCFDCAHGMHCTFCKERMNAAQKPSPLKVSLKEVMEAAMNNFDPNKYVALDLDDATRYAATQMTATEMKNKFIKKYANVMPIDQRCAICNFKFTEPDIIVFVLPNKHRVFCSYKCLVIDIVRGTIGAIENDNLDVDVSWANVLHTFLEELTRNE